MKSDPGSLGSVKTIDVLSAGAAPIGSRPITMKRVTLWSWSWIPAASDTSPNTSPARAEAIAAASLSRSSAISFALPAVS